MIALKHILVPTDFSEPSATALRYGRDLARSYGATLHVIHVAEDLITRYSLDMYPTGVDEMQEDLEKTSRQRLNAMVTDEDRVQLHARTEVWTSNQTAAAIAEYAAQHDVDLIVMGTHGRTGMSHMFMGSVAERVVRTAGCPVLTVRAPEREFIAPDALVAAARA
jgi:nucleotide-binding universal stress UspA family protein